MGKRPKNITLGTTKFQDLPEILGYEEVELESRRARLFPVGNTIDEVNTTSIFLSTLAAVKEYREFLLSEIGVAKIKNRNIKLHVFTEVSLGSNNKKNENDRPDGLIVLTSGKRDPVIDWISFVESKVRSNPLQPDQISNYIKIGRDLGIKSLITISNDMVTSPLDLPYKVNSRNFDLYHWSWTYLKVMSTRLLRIGAIEDEDHHYILSEFRRFIETNRNVSNYTNMGSDWKDDIQEIYQLNNGEKPDKELIDRIVSSYIQEEKDIALQLTDRTNYYVQLHLKNNEDRKDSLSKILLEDKRLESEFFIDGNRKNIFKLCVDIQRKSISCECIVKITDGKAKRQTTLLLDKLSPASETDVVVKAVYNRNKSNGYKTLSMLFNEKKNGDFYSVLNKDYGGEVKYFIVSIQQEIGKDMNGNRKFIEYIEKLSETFLNQIVRYVLLGEK